LLPLITTSTDDTRSTASDRTDDQPVRGSPGGTCTGACEAPTIGLLKICKVAGTGIALGTPSNFTLSTSATHDTVSVPAGGAPGGTCMLGPTYPVGAQVDVTEAPMAGATVSNISVAVGTPGHVVGANLPGRGVAVVIGKGVTEVTFTGKRTGFVAICKRGEVKGSFSFMVNPGNLGPFLVPTGACSPAIEVAAGAVTIRELATGFDIACNTVPPYAQQPICNMPPGTPNSVVIVAPGDISAMTIAFVTNKPAAGSPPQ
jgi:hypothetical protein